MSSAALAVRNDSTRALATHGSSAEFEISAPVLDTPRSREACKKLGYVIEDLQFRPYEAFAIPGDPKEKQTLRFNHAEKKRKERLAQVLAERAKVIAQNAKKGNVPGVQSAQFLGMLENLFEKEAKRLETDLKSQLRHHKALVSENELQVQKEETLATQHMKRESRRQAAKDMREAEATRVRASSESRTQRSQDVLSKLGDEFTQKQVLHCNNILAEQERLERFMLEKGATNDQKAAVWKAKVDGMKEKSKQMSIEARENGERRLDEIQARLAGVEARREAELMERAMRSEDQHLHIMDVREQKDRIDRVDHHRRDELKEHVDNNVERVETLIALKDQLLDQRRARQQKAEATKNSRGLNLRRDCLPGPGQYEAPASCLTEAPVGKINPSIGVGFIDAQTRITASNPAPGQYDLSVMPNGDFIGKAQPNCVQFGNRDRDSYLDDAQKAKDFMPAPGRYEAKTGLAERGTKMARPRVDNQGLDKKSAKRFPVWARPATETPGPGGYSVDEYTRKEVLRRAQRSLPNLTKDMLKLGVPGKA